METFHSRPPRFGILDRLPRHPIRGSAGRHTTGKDGEEGGEEGASQTGKGDIIIPRTAYQAPLLRPESRWSERLLFRKNHEFSCYRVCHKKYDGNMRKKLDKGSTEILRIKISS